MPFGEVAGVAGGHERVLAVLAIREPVAPLAGDLGPEPASGGCFPGAAVRAGWVDAFGPAVGLHTLEFAPAFEHGTAGNSAPAGIRFAQAKTG